MRSKGKVYPTPTPHPSSASPLAASSGDSLSIFKVLPAAILAVAVVLTLEEREVLAYMITRSINSTNPWVKNKKRSVNTHKPPVFDCECFVCYTSYWFKWDSSPNRELIHQAIEAFEDHLNNSEHSKKKGKKRAKASHRHFVGKPEVSPSKAHQSLPEVLQREEEPEPEPDQVLIEVSQSPPGLGAESEDKGWARTVLPDVLGALNSRLWSLWSPNV